MTIRGIVLAGFLTVLIAGCTPPMPPDVLAARAEAQVACGTGEVRVSVPTGFSGAMDAVGAALSSVCPDETVFEVPVDESAPLALVDKTPLRPTSRHLRPLHARIIRSSSYRHLRIP